MADQRYYNMNAKGEDNRYKVNTNILRMMQANPTLGTGYIIGSMLGENYWGKKRAKSEKKADRIGRGEDGSIGADANGTYGTSKEPNYYSSMNKALDEYRNNPNGRTLYSGSNVQTPQQANKPAVTTENAGNGGGVPSVADAWNSMNNASVYNPGNTGLYTNGSRDLGNVMYSGRPAVEPANSALAAYNSSPNGNVLYSGTGNNGGSSNPGVYIDTARGIFPNSPRDTRPAGPTPYTDDQLRQIAAQNFTPDEQSRMMTADERARMNALTAPPVQAVPVAAPAQAPAPSETPTPDARSYAPSPISETDDHAPYYANPLSESDDHGQGEETAIGVLQNAVNNFSRANATRAGATDFANAYQPAGGSGAPRLQWDDPSLPFWNRKLVFK